MRVIMLLPLAAMLVAGCASLPPKPQGLPATRTVLLPGDVPLKMVGIPAGEFAMGSRRSPEELVALFGLKPDWYASSDPLHRVRITRPFYIGQFEFTQDQWRAVAGGNPSAYTGRVDSGSRPVESVTWLQIDTFLGRLQAFAPEGWRFRLPTEAEWEYACRAGTDTEYPAGDRLEPGQANITFPQVRNRETVAVGSFKPNPWGLYDMVGNVWEYCQDGWDPGFYAKSPADDPLAPGPRDGSHVMRGGSFDYTPVYGRSAHRGWNGDVPEKASAHRGFRVVLARD